MKVKYHFRIMCIVQSVVETKHKQDYMKKDGNFNKNYSKTFMLKKLGLSFYFFQKVFHSLAQPGVGKMEQLVYEEYLENQPTPVPVLSLIHI